MKWFIVMYIESFFFSPPKTVKIKTTLPLNYCLQSLTKYPFFTLVKKEILCKLLFLKFYLELCFSLWNRLFSFEMWNQCISSYLHSGIEKGSWALSVVTIVSFWITLSPPPLLCCSIPITKGKFTGHLQSFKHLKKQ